MRTGRSGKLNNKGFSLVELIIVIAIMMVVLGGVVTWTGMLYRRAARQCAEELKQEFGRVRIDTMGKGSVLMKLFELSDGYYISAEIESIPTDLRPVYADDAEGSTGHDPVGTATALPTEQKKVGSIRCTLTFFFEDGSSEVLAAGSDAEFGFDRATGAFNKNEYGGKKIKSIEIESAGRVYTLKLNTVTGEVEMVS